MNAIAMITACCVNQGKQYAETTCCGCGEPVNWGQASTAGWYGLCGLCAMRVELGLIERPNVPTFWEVFDV